MQDESSADTFSGRAAVLFVSQVVGAMVGIVNGILIASFLGPAGKGDYYLLVIVPATTMVLIQFGLPHAFQFYSARGHTARMFAKALLLTGVLSAIGYVAVAVLMPVLREAFLHGLDTGLVLFAFIALPLALSATFTTAIVMGRQAVRWYAAVNIATSLATTVLIVLILGWQGATVASAILVFLIGLSIKATGFAIGSRRVTAANPRPQSVSFPELLKYGFPLYPATLTQYFSYRADAYLIAFLIASPSESLGYYSMAVGLAELVFFFPNAVSTLFFPHVAGSLREDSDRQAATVARVTFLVTAVVALALVPGAMLMISILLPAFGPSIPPLLVLLPGVAVLSVTKVLSGYVSGIGRPGVTSYINVMAFVLNIVANVVLIPRYGIIGAAAASLISYSMSSIAFSVLASRLTRTPILHFWLPRLADVTFIFRTSLGLVRRIRNTARGMV